MRLFSKAEIAKIKKRTKEERKNARREGRVLMTEVVATAPKGAIATPKSNVLDRNRKAYNRGREKSRHRKEEY